VICYKAATVNLLLVDNLKFHISVALHFTVLTEKKRRVIMAAVPQPIMNTPPPKKKEISIQMYNAKEVLDSFTMNLSKIQYY